MVDHGLTMFIPQGTFEVHLLTGVDYCFLLISNGISHYVKGLSQTIVGFTILMQHAIVDQEVVIKSSRKWPCDFFKQEKSMLLDLSFHTVGNFSCITLQIKEEKLCYNITSIMKWNECLLSGPYQQNIIFSY